MAKLEKLEDVRIIDLVKGLIKEKITKSWLKDMLAGKMYAASHFFRDSSEAEFFDICIWDNLTPDQQKKVIEEINILLEEDLYIKMSSETCSYLYNLITLVCLIEEKIPLSINPYKIFKWKEENYPNLTDPTDNEHPLRKSFTQKIEKAFLKGEKK